MPLTPVLSKLRQKLKVKTNFSKEQASNPLNPSTQVSSVVYRHRVVGQPEPHSEAMTKQNKQQKQKGSNRSINGKKETIELHIKSHSLIGKYEDSFSTGHGSRHSESNAILHTQQGTFIRHWPASCLAYSIISQANPTSLWFKVWLLPALLH